MHSETDSDPQEPREAREDEIEAWVAREHRRRQAWLDGPSRAERDEWARRYRRRAAVGLEESPLGPLEEEIEAWAERERKRRAGWAAGPTEDERHAWARSWRQRAPFGLGDSPLAPSDEEIEAWAARERKRRAAWLAGPTREEMRRQLAEPAGPSPGPAPTAAAVPDGLFEELELAARGSLWALTRGPFALWSSLVRIGRSREEERLRGPRRGRVPF